MPCWSTKIISGWIDTWVEASITLTSHKKTPAGSCVLKVATFSHWGISYVGKWHFHVQVFSDVAWRTPNGTISIFYCSSEMWQEQQASHVFVALSSTVFSTNVCGDWNPLVSPWNVCCQRLCMFAFYGLCLSMSSSSTKLVSFWLLFIFNFHSFLYTHNIFW